MAVRQAEAPSRGWAAPRSVVTRSGATVEIRAAGRGDVAALLAYFRIVGGETEDLTFGDEGLGITEAEEEKHVERTRETPNALMLVATIEGEIVAVLTFAGGVRARTRHAGELGISVARAHWGEGIGRALMESMLAWGAFVGGVRKVNLHVVTTNARAIALYEKLGFVVEGRQSRTVRMGEEFRETLLMGRCLDPVADPGS